MGHLYRAISLTAALGRAGHDCRILVNAHQPSLRVLKAAGIPHSIVDLSDVESDWEGRLIREAQIRVWVDDRLNTVARHAAYVKRRGISLVTFDDRGPGAASADLHVAALAFDPGEELTGRRILRGIEYLILNPEIIRYQRPRQHAGALLVTLGGSDTYGVTAKVVRCLRHASRTATVIVGPGFDREAELAAALGPGFELKRSVPSLIEEFARHDFAITGGGITPFEANASGLPCIVVANELFEIQNARALEAMGSSVFAGHHLDIDETVITSDLPIEAMSRAGIERIGLGGIDRVIVELLSL